MQIRQPQMVLTVKQLNIETPGRNIDPAKILEEVVIYLAVDGRPGPRGVTTMTRFEQT